MAEQTKTYQCPSCNAPLSYDGKAEKLLCEYCGAEIEAAAFAAETAEEETGAVSWEKYGEGKVDWGEDGKVTLFTCPSCGGEIVCEGDTAATVCPYCDNPALIASRLSGSFRPDRVIPFAISKEDAVAAMEKLCKGKLLLPRSFHKERRVESLKGIYVPFWLYDCDTNSRFVYRGTRKTSWRAGDYRYTRTSHYRLFRRGLMDFYDIPVDASVKLDNTLLESIEPYDYTAAVPFSDAYLAGYAAQRYDDSAETCAVRAKERVAKSVDAAMGKTVRGYLTVTKTEEQIFFTKSEVEYALLPVYFMNIRYREKEYPFVINGQTGKMSGKLPLSRGRFAAFLSGLTLLFGGLFSLIALAI